MTQNKTLIFKKVPTGFPVAGEHLVVEDRPIDLDAPPSGGLVVQLLYSSFDPYLRGRMRSPEVKSYSPPFKVGDPIVSHGVFRVLKSDSPDFSAGELALSYQPVAQYARVAKEQLAGVTKINNPYGLDVAYFIGQLGMPGLTAYSSLYKIGQPKAGETIFVSSAAGAVGQIVGQLAKHEGLKVIGSVGSDEKLEFITKELGFDSGFNYKKEKPRDALKRLAPDGIDIYYENVGGEHLEAALDSLKTNGRIVACGSISGYNQKPEEKYPIRNFSENVVPKRLKVEGFIVSDPAFGPAYAKEHQEKVQKWLADGSFKAKLSVTEGIDNAAEGLVGIFQGKNFGKAVLKISD